MNKANGASVSGMSIDDALDPDLLQIILSRLPALCFASAACVNRTWNSICSRILSSPKLTSAISLNPSLDVAVDEVIEKVLSQPIRPHFAVAYVGPSFSLPRAHHLITDRLGSGVPVVTSLSDGIIGRDALTDEFKEIHWVQWHDVDEDVDENVDDEENNLKSGILLMIGYLPGLKVIMIPLTSQDGEEDETLLIDEFVTNIREYTSSVSASASPDAIMLFTDLKTDMRPVLQKMDYAFPSETIIVGDGGGRLLYRSNWRGCSRRRGYIAPAVALLFVKDRDKAAGIGETKFFAALSSGIRPIGPRYKAASVKEKPSERSTWLSARRESVNENLDGQALLFSVYDEIIDQDLFIGIKKRRKCSIGREKVRWSTFLELHEVSGGDEEYLYVNNSGIRTGDPFQFYVTDGDAALSSLDLINNAFKRLKPPNDASSSSSNQQTRSTDISGSSSSKPPLVFGGFVFACRGRGEVFLGKNADSNPFMENFPEASFAGTFCNGEIKRGKSGLPIEQEGFENCYLHFYTSVYLLWSYIPVQSPQD